MTPVYVPLSASEAFRSLVRFRGYSPVMLYGISPRIIIAVYRQEFRRSIESGWMPNFTFNKNRTSDASQKEV